MSLQLVYFVTQRLRIRTMDGNGIRECYDPQDILGVQGSNIYNLCIVPRTTNPGNCTKSYIGKSEDKHMKNINNIYSGYLQYFCKMGNATGRRGCGWRQRNESNKTKRSLTFE